jgi:hypothetical protein
MQDLHDLFLAGSQFVKKPVLSDEGLGLKQFCKDHGHPHYYCHRHLIEKWGANGRLGMLVTRALREPSKELFYHHLEVLVEDARAILQAGLITKAEYDKFIVFLNLEGEFEHGLWLRIADGVSSCSNHAERFHGVINQHLGHFTLLVERLWVIAQQIRIRWAMYPGDFRQLRDTINALRKCNAVQRNCDCDACLAYRAVMNSRFGIVNFPCRHTLWSWSIHDVPPMPELKLPALPDDSEEERRKEGTIDSEGTAIAPAAAKKSQPQAIEELVPLPPRDAPKEIPPPVSS